VLGLTPTCAWPRADVLKLNFFCDGVGQCGWIHSGLSKPNCNDCRRLMVGVKLYDMNDKHKYKVDSLLNVLAEDENIEEEEITIEQLKSLTARELIDFGRSCACATKPPPRRARRVLPSPLTHTLCAVLAFGSGDILFFVRALQTMCGSADCTAPSTAVSGSRSTSSVQRCTAAAATWTR
jgi:hypothetical protein